MAAVWVGLVNTIKEEASEAVRNCESNTLDCRNPLKPKWCPWGEGEKGRLPLGNGKRLYVPAGCSSTGKGGRMRDGRKG